LAPLVPGQGPPPLPKGTAVLEGRVAPADVLALDPCLRLLGTGPMAGVALPREVRSFPIGEDGRFRITDLPAGTWRVQFEANFPIEGFANPLSCAGVARRRPHLAEVELKEGEVTTVALDAKSCVPARVRGRVRMDGVLLRDLEVGLQGRQPASPQSPLFGIEYALGPLALDEGGRFEREPMLPGQYRVAVRLPAPQGGAPVLRWSEWFEVEPGAKIERDFEVYERRLRVTLRDAAGAPVANTKLMLMVGAAIEGIGETDADGVLVLDNAPTDPVTIRLGPRSAVVQMPLGKKEASVEARLQQ
jgi:hypothetical protein